MIQLAAQSFGALAAGVLIWVGFALAGYVAGHIFPIQFLSNKFNKKN
jgi:hypothetical protein